MKKQILTFLCCFLVAMTSWAQDRAMSPFGYCGTSVTGGGNATPTLVSTLDEFKAATTKPTTPKVIIITQNIEFNALYTIQDTKDLTILALPGVKLFSNEQTQTTSGILYFKRCSNIILRNLTFEGPGAYDCDGNDCLCFQDVTYSWVDHCDFQDGCDGNFDNKNGTDNVTVSWCRFHYLKEPKAGGSGGTADHRFTNLLGSSSTDKPEDGTYNMTWAYCWWDEGCKERMVRCRNASLHFLGCYWNSSVANYYIGPENVDAYVELCTFEGNPSTSNIFKSYNGSTNGVTFVNSVAMKGLPADISDRPVLVPSYSAPKYSSAAESKEAVMEYAGATLYVDEQGNVSGTNTATNTPVINVDLESSTTAYVGQSKTLSATFKYAESYQWYRNTTASNTGGTVINGATSNSYTFTPSAVGTYYYYCVATNSQATGTKSVASAVCTVTVNAAPTMWTAATAQYNSTSKGYEVAGVGTYYKSTSGGTTTINDDAKADWIADNKNIRTGSSLFIFSPAIAVTGLKLYVIDSSNRVLSSTECSSTLNGTYSAQGSAADKDVSKDTYTDVTITFNSTVAANQFIKVTFSGNVNVYGIEPINDPAPTPQTYTVSYNLKGHGAAIADVTDVTALPATLPTPTADGWAFWGWFTDDACTNAAIAGAEISDNTTLYAKWTDASTTSGAWSIDFSAIGDAESLADKAGVAISSRVAGINSVDMGVIKMGNTYLNNNFVIQTGKSWIYRTAQKAIYSLNSGNSSFGMRNMKAGQTITMHITDASTLTPTNATLESSANDIYVYNVTADGDVAFSINRYSYIYTINVSAAPAPPRTNMTLFSWESTSNSNEGVHVTGGTVEGTYKTESNIYVMQLSDKPSSMEENKHVVVTLTGGNTFAKGDVIVVTGFYSKNSETQTSVGVIPGSASTGNQSSNAILGTDSDWPNNYGKNYSENGFSQVTHYYTLTDNFDGATSITLTRGSKSGTALDLTKVEITRAATVTATVASTRRFGSFSSVYNVDFGDDDDADVKAYTAVVSNDGTTVTLTRHRGVLPAGNGVVLYAPGATKSQTFGVVNEATALAAENSLIGVPVATNVEMSTAGGQAYVVNSDAFRPLSQSGTIAAGKAYLRIPDGGGSAKVVTMVMDEDATSISNRDFFNEKPAVMRIYNLQGIEVKNPVRGHIYIINNKKCLFK